MPEKPPIDPFSGIAEIEQITLDACNRIQECLNDRGQHSDGYKVATQNSWLARRQMARTTYSGNLDHRRILGGVFNVQSGGNLSLRTYARIVSLRAAKQAADLVGMEPFMQAMPAKIEDKEDATLAKQGEAKVQEEIARSNLRMVFAEGIRIGLSEGESPIKITWQRNVTEYPEDMEVAVDAVGNPIRTPKGKYIFRKDDILALVTDDQGNFLRKALMEGGAVVEELQPGERIELRLKKEPAFVFAEAPTNFAVIPDLLHTVVHRDGLHAAPLFVEDFIYPPNVASLEDPDCDVMCHRYDAPLDDVLEAYGNANYKDAEQHAPEHIAPASFAGQALETAGEIQRSDRAQQTTCIHETYFRRWLTAADGRRFQTWLFIVIDYQRKRPIYANYLGRMRMKRPPFMLLRGLESQPGRAYGVGIWEKFADREIMIDCWFNRAAQKSSMTNSITCAHVDGLEEVKDKLKIVFGTSKVYRILSGSEYGANNPPIFRVNLSEMSDKEYELLQTLIQSGEVEFGMISAADGATGQDTVNNGTATAVRSLERTGNTLNESSEALQAADITKGLEIAVDAIFENMDPEELRWTPGVEMLATLSKDEIQQLQRNVRLLVTKAKGSDLIEINTAAKNALLEYSALPASQKRMVRDQYVEILRNLYVADADEKLHNPTDEEIAAEANSEQPPAPTTVNLRLGDLDGLAPSERDAILQKYFGVKGASPAELQQMQQQEHQMEMEKETLRLLAPPGQDKEKDSTPKKEPAKKAA